MAYQPKKADIVSILDYKGMLHPLTLWVVKETRPDLSLVCVPDQKPDGTVVETHEHWVENKQLVKQIRLPRI